MSVREHYQVMRVSRLSPTFLVVGPGRMASGAVVAPEAARNRTRGERDRKAWSMLRDQPEEQMAAVCASATGFLSEGETTRREALVKPSPLFSDIPASECRELLRRPMKSTLLGASRFSSKAIRFGELSC